MVTGSGSGLGSGLGFFLRLSSGSTQTDAESNLATEIILSLLQMFQIDIEENPQLSGALELLRKKLYDLPVAFTVWQATQEGVPPLDAYRNEARAHRKTIEDAEETTNKLLAMLRIEARRTARMSLPEKMIVIANTIASQPWKVRGLF